MKTSVGHFWVQGTDGRFNLYEADYSTYRICKGVLGCTMVHHSERLCTCSERELHERRLAAISN